MFDKQRKPLNKNTEKYLPIKNMKIVSFSTFTNIEEYAKQVTEQHDVVL